MKNEPVWVDGRPAITLLLKKNFVHHGWFKTRVEVEAKLVQFLDDKTVEWIEDQSRVNLGPNADGRYPVHLPRSGV